MTQTVDQFKENMKVYQAFEESPLGHLVRDGYLNISVNSKSKDVEASYHPTVGDRFLIPVGKYGDVDTLIDDILTAVGVDFSLTEITEDPIAIQQFKYAYLVYNKSEDGIRTLLFGTVYNYSEIEALKDKYLNPLW